MSKRLDINLTLDTPTSAVDAIHLGGVVITEGMSVRQVEDAMKASARFVLQYLHEHEFIRVDLREQKGIEG